MKVVATGAGGPFVSVQCRKSPGLIVVVCNRGNTLPNGPFELGILNQFLAFANTEENFTA